MLSCAVAVTLMYLVFGVVDVLNLRREAKHDLGVWAKIIAARSASAVTTRDSAAGAAILESLASRNQIVHGWLRDRDGNNVVAEYDRAGEPAAAPTAFEPARRGHFFTAAQEIDSAHEKIGTAVLEADLSQVRADLLEDIETLSLALIVAAIVATWVAWRLQQHVAEPILELAQTAFTIATTNDFSLRAKKTTDDEIGYLDDQFNAVLARVEEHEKASLQIHEVLEERVEERTRALQIEMAEREKAAEALRNSKERLQALIGSIDDIVFEFDADGTYLNIWTQREEMLIKPKKELLGRRLSEVYDEHSVITEMLQRLVKTGKSETLELPVNTPNGQRWFQGRCTPIPSEDGSYQTICVLARDVTVQKQAEIEIQRAKELAEAASRAKGDFLANMSHEIRTPMNGILGMVELALDTDLTPEQREYLATVKSSADSLLTLINDILDFSKIEAGHLDFVKVDMSIRDTLGETMHTLAHRANQRGLELACRIKPNVPAWVTGDPGRLRQIVVNLIGNALKFTEKGEVILEVEQESESESSVVLHFKVRDTGIGISPEKIGLIFEAFTQADSSTTRKHGGTGLGLAITRRLVELFGGQIWAESELGRGSTFHFTIPFGRADEKVRRTWPHAREALRDLKVLVVDDNQTMRTILDELLKSWGMAPQSVAGGEAALEALEMARTSGAAFALVLMDVQMPGMDGFSVAREILTRWQNDAPKILMLSSSAQRGESARCREMGIAGYLTKPVQQSELLNTISHVMLIDEETKDPGVVTRYSIRKGRTGMRILLAEDNAVNRLVATRLLEKLGHDVLSALNGREAVQMAGHDAFDLALMDVQMPEMDGFEATRAIREREKSTGKHLPIIAMTAHAMKGDRERCLDSGMDDYLTKPVHTVELQALLKKYEPAATVAASEAEPEPIWDAARALERVGKNQEILNELIMLLEAECPKMLDSIRVAIGRKDPKAVELGAHSLKGAASYFFAPSVIAAARELEKEAHEKTLENADALFAQIETESQKLLEELEAYTRKVPS